VDEIVVVDSYSTDSTKDICLAEGVKFIEQAFLGYVEQKNFALQHTKYNYIISLDADEALSPELQKTVKNLKNNWQYDGYYVNLFNFFNGQWIKHSDWYPYKKLRIFDKTKARWTGYKIHETVKPNNPKAKIGHLKGNILHYTYRSYKEMDDKTQLFSSISAQAYFEQGKKAPLYKLIINPTWAFFKAFFLRLGFLDGKNGFYICYQTGKITYLKYAKLRTLYKQAH
jgi:glycosyltransferase involved in cell wall biosynthesis